MSEVKWIKIATDIFDDEKILLIESLPESDSLIVIWFKLLSFAGKSNNNGVFMMSNKVPYTDEMLATIFRRNINTVRLALQTFEAFGMIERYDDVITIPNWDKHQNVDGMQKIKEQTRKRVAEYRQRQKLMLGDGNVTGNVTVTECNGTDKEEDKDKNKNIYLDEFDSLWNLYPNKKGKANAEKSYIKARKQGTTYEEVKAGIESYKKYIDINKTQQQYIKHGSTWFNQKAWEDSYETGSEIITADSITAFDI
ncbi:MAG: phage replisome organizer N-terminal domain-containing protein [Bacilli bacterium]|nr:phage replisome organizer N-terminal domain-containing protein [Bacilli bacterium]